MEPVNIKLRSGLQPAVLPPAGKNPMKTAAALSGLGIDPEKRAAWVCAIVNRWWK